MVALELLLRTILLVVLAISLITLMIMVIVRLSPLILTLMPMVCIEILPMSKIILLGGIYGSVVHGITSGTTRHVGVRIHIVGFEIRLLHIILVASWRLLLIILLLPNRVFVASMIVALLFSAPTFVLFLTAWITISHVKLLN